MSELFSPLKIRDLTFRNRIGVSPMCMYSAEDGLPNEWHLVHLGSRAVGGAALVMAEASSVTPNGRISPSDAGIWNDDQASAWAPVARFIADQGAIPAIQLAHAGRKAGTDVPWQGGKPLCGLGWDLVGPSAIPFTDSYLTPREMSIADIAEIVNAFRSSAKRALDAGFQVVEIHGAHGYLLNSFVSPLANHRTDAYGGNFKNRTRIVRDVASAIREVWPESLPLFIRFSATDWVERGWDLEQSIQLACDLKELGVDLVDCSSGGNSASAQIPVGPGYQVQFAEGIRKASGVLTAAVGLITDTGQAEGIIQDGQADMVFLARELLRDPYWPRRAAQELGAVIDAPNQYRRAW
ncbi:MAG: NADH:flavin oxidoreductase/NADH oxidase [Chlorobia bacterium]|nr:NADH:flavin oxidoreductase/NADH oxidase [Fimbriimonadaceae bacterium]